MTRLGRTVLVLALLAVSGMWIYAFSGVAGKDHPDHLDDRAFPDAARPLCEGAQAAIAALPTVGEIDSAAERADTVDAANEILRDLVTDLEALERPLGDDGRIVAKWVADWEVHIADRQAWADGLRAGRDEQFFETEKGEGPISEVMDNFATVNDLDACKTPTDV